MELLLFIMVLVEVVEMAQPLDLHQVVEMVLDIALIHPVQIMDEVVVVQYQLQDQFKQELT
tara:strand:- start:444 stop:626 length:183 start_codon:yes stop_codon:yes gene_type:complete